MTKKDFINIADVLAFVQNEVLKGRCTDEGAVPLTAELLADYFAQVNPLFNRSQFMQAACL